MIRPVKALFQLITFSSLFLVFLGCPGTYDSGGGIFDHAEDLQYIQNGDLDDLTVFKSFSVFDFGAGTKWVARGAQLWEKNPGTTTHWSQLTIPGAISSQFGPNLTVTSMSQLTSTDMIITLHSISNDSYYIHTSGIVRISGDPTVAANWTLLTRYQGGHGKDWVSYLTIPLWAGGQANTSSTTAYISRELKSAPDESNQGATYRVYYDFYLYGGGSSPVSDSDFFSNASYAQPVYQTPGSVGSPASNIAGFDGRRRDGGSAVVTEIISGCGGTYMIYNINKNDSDYQKRGVLVSGSGTSFTSLVSSNFDSTHTSRYAYKAIACDTDNTILALSLFNTGDSGGHGFLYTFSPSPSAISWSSNFDAGTDAVGPLLFAKYHGSSTNDVLLLGTIAYYYDFGNGSGDYNSYDGNGYFEDPIDVTNKVITQLSIDDTMHFTDWDNYSSSDLYFSSVEGGFAAPAGFDDNVFAFSDNEGVWLTYMDGSTRDWQQE